MLRGGIKLWLAELDGKHLEKGKTAGVKEQLEKYK